MLKEELMQVFEAGKDLPYMAVVVETGQVRQAVVFSNKNFTHMKYHYDRTYDDRLFKKDNPNVKILAAEAGHTVDIDILLQEPEVEV